MHQRHCVYDYTDFAHEIGTITSLMRKLSRQARMHCIVSALAALVLAGCSNGVSFETQPLDRRTAQSELLERGIAIPDGYSLVAMDRLAPQGSGGASYTGAFDSPTPVPPILIDGTPASLRPSTCGMLTPDRFPRKWFDLGLDCHTMSDVRLGGGRPRNASVVTVTIVTGVLAAGGARIYLLAAGN